MLSEHTIHRTLSGSSIELLNPDPIYIPLVLLHITLNITLPHHYTAPHPQYFSPSTYNILPITVLFPLLRLWRSGHIPAVWTGGPWVCSCMR